MESFMPSSQNKPQFCNNLHIKPRDNAMIISLQKIYLAWYGKLTWHGMYIHGIIHIYVHVQYSIMDKAELISLSHMDSE